MGTIKATADETTRYQYEIQELKAISEKRTLELTEKQERSRSKAKDDLQAAIRTVEESTKNQIMMIEQTH